MGWWGISLWGLMLVLWRCLRREKEGGAENKGGFDHSEYSRQDVGKKNWLKASHKHFEA